jgi:hypothetical protein
VTWVGRYMITRLTTKIVFSDGASATVTLRAEEVEKRLVESDNAGERFAQFPAQGGQDVYVAVDRVAYLQQIGSDD